MCSYACFLMYGVGVLSLWIQWCGVVSEAGTSLGYSLWLCSFQNCCCAFSHDNSLLKNQAYMFICHWEGSHWCPLHVIKAAVFLIPITSPSCQHFMHVRLSLTHVSSPFDNISLMINSLFWLALHLTDLSLVPRLWMRNYASFPCVCLYGLDRNDFTPSLLYHPSPHQLHGSNSTTKTFFVPWKVFLHNWQKFLYDWHFSLLHLETVGCVTNNTYVKIIFVCNIMRNYYFFCWFPATFETFLLFYVYLWRLL